MSKRDDVFRLEFLRCPECHSRLDSVWNLSTTGLVMCTNTDCKKGGIAVLPSDCVDISDEEMELCMIEDLEEVN